MLRLIQPRKRTVLIEGRITEMAREQIVEAIDSETLATIRTADPHPLLVALSVGHEGISTGTVVGRGAMEKVWTDDAVGELAEKVTGAKVYLNHATGPGVRKSHGTVVGSLLKTIGSRLHAVAVAHITTTATRRKIDAGLLDACSIEADCLFAPINATRWVVKAVEAVTGVALASGELFTPGFKHAGVLAAVQEFEQKEAPTVEDVREAVAELKLAPEKLFDPEVLLSAPFVRDAIENEVAALEAELRPFREERARRDWAKKVVASGHLKNAERSLVAYLGDTLPQPPGACDQVAADALVASELKRMARYGIAFGRVQPAAGHRPAAPTPPDNGRTGDYTRPEQNDLIPR